MEGDHEAIIDPETFDMVQREIEKRGIGKKYHSGIYPFSSKIKCGECGSWYGSKVWHSNDKYRHVIWQCNHKYDGDKRCSTPHLTDDQVKAAFLSAANKLLATKDEVTANGREMLGLFFDTKELETERDNLLIEATAVSEAVQKTIYENAHVAQDQANYQQKYDALVKRYDELKTQIDNLNEQISTTQANKAGIEDFLTAFEKTPDTLTEFSVESFSSLVDFITVYSEKDIRVTFKNGQEIDA